MNEERIRKLLDDKMPLGVSEKGASQYAGDRYSIRELVVLGKISDPNFDIETLDPDEMDVLENLIEKEVV